MHSSESSFAWEVIQAGSINEAVSAIPLPIPFPVIHDGEIYRFPTNNEDSDTAGFYRWYGSVFRAGDWRTGKAWKWINGGAGPQPTDHEPDEVFEKQEKEDRSKAMERAQALCDASQEAVTHPYLEHKKLAPVGLRVYQNLLLVPAFAGQDKLMAIQKIDQLGSKFFLTGTSAKGAFFALKKGEQGTIYITESVANALAIYHSVDSCIALSTFGLNNMKTVAQMFAKAIEHQKPPQPIVVIGDNDPHGQGEEAAKKAAKSSLGKLCLPQFGDLLLPDGSRPSDIADTWLLMGADGVREALSSAKEPVEVVLRKLIRLEDSDLGKYMEESQKVRDQFKWDPRLFDRYKNAEAKRWKEEIKAEKAKEEAKEEAPKDVHHVDPWPHPVKGSDLLNELVDTYSRFLILPRHCAEAMSLWCIHTYLMDVLNIAPYLAFASPEKRCGKTQGLTLLFLTCYRPLMNVNISSAVLYRLIERDHPALLIDEFDSFMKNEDLRGILNAGYTRQTAIVIRCVGDEHEPKEFSVWAAKAFTLIGTLPDTLKDRTIIIPMKRRLKTEAVDRLRLRDRVQFEPLKSKCYRFALDHKGEIAQAVPELPEDLNDRAQDIWEPLFAIADIAGGDWPNRARQAARVLSGSEEVENVSIGVQLLEDIHEYFQEKKTHTIFSADLIKHLGGLEERPWPEYKYGKPITHTQMARLLKKFKIRSKTVRIKEITNKGYSLEQFADTFSRYIPGSNPSHRHNPDGMGPAENPENVTKKAQPVTPSQPRQDGPSRGPEKDPEAVTNSKDDERVTSNVTSNITSNLTNLKDEGSKDLKDEKCDGSDESRKAAPDKDCDGCDGSGLKCDVSAPAPEATPQATCDGVTAQEGVSEKNCVYKMISTEIEFGAMITQLMESKAIALDFETTGLDPHKDRATLASLSTREHPTFLVDLNKISIERLGVLFASGDRHLLAYNARFELGFLAKAGVWLPSGKLVFDPMIGAQLIDAGRYGKKKAPKGTHDLQGVVKRYLDIDLDKTQQKSDWSGEFSKEQLDYAARDSQILFSLYEKVHHDLTSAKLMKTFEIEMLCIPAMVMLDMNGTPIDTEAWIKNADQLLLAAGKARRALDSFFKKHKTKLDPAVLEDLLFKKAKIDKKKNVIWDSPDFVKALLRGRGHDIQSVDKKVLAMLGLDPFLDLYRTYRAVKTLCSHYGRDKLTEHLNPDTGRMYSDFHQIGTTVGRTTSSKPNLQNVPRDKAFRSLIRVPEGRKIIKADYGQLHLRIAAVIAPDEVLLEVFRKGEDPHTITASNISGIPCENIPKELRHQAKAVNLGFLYGLGPQGFVIQAKKDYGVDFSLEEAGAYRDKHFEKFFGLKNWHRKQPKKPIETRSMWGRRRLNVTVFGEKLSSPVLGTEADGIKLAMGRIYEDRDAFPEVKLILMNHDELVFEAPADQAEAAAIWIHDHMVDAMEEGTDHKVPIEVETKIADTWAGD